jgi:hypothetical protein
MRLMLWVLRDMTAIATGRGKSRELCWNFSTSWMGSTPEETPRLGMRI